MPQLTLSVASSAANQSLTALALTDWMAVHNPTPAVDFKSGAGNTIGITRYGGGGDATTGALARTISWTDGTNFGTGSISDAVQNGGGANTGYEITFPAATALRQAKIYLGGFSSTVKVTAIISDASTGNQIDTTLTGVSSTFVLGVATVIYQASGTATLTVRVESQSGLSSPSVLIQGAAWGAYTPPSIVTGSIDLADFVHSGAFAVGALSQLAGGITLDDFLNSGTLGLAPGRIDTAPFKNWTGTLLPGITVPNVVFLKLDRTLPLALANQVTAGDGVMTITNSALVTGTYYIMVSYNADGSAAGAELVLAT